MFSCRSCHSLAFHFSASPLSCATCGTNAFLATCVVFGHANCLGCRATVRATVSATDRPPEECRVCQTSVAVNPRKHWASKKHAQRITDCSLEAKWCRGCKVGDRRRSWCTMSEISEARFPETTLVIRCGRVDICIICGGISLAMQHPAADAPVFEDTYIAQALSDEW
jgi:hypothetical protein